MADFILHCHDMRVFYSAERKGLSPEEALHAGPALQPSHKIALQ